MHRRRETTWRLSRHGWTPWRWLRRAPRGLGLALPVPLPVLLPLVPLRDGDAWLYELMDGTQVDAKGALALAKKKKSRLVLIIEADTPVQSYLDAETPFRKLGARIGLAVKKEGDGK